jgi:hypothetical protein
MVLPFLVVALAGSASASVNEPRTLIGSNPHTSVCQQIADSLSNVSAVYYPGSLQYTTDMNHWAASSSDTSACSVRPGSAADVGAIVRYLDVSAPWQLDDGSTFPLAEDCWWHEDAIRG